MFCSTWSIFLPSAGKFLKETLILVDPKFIQWIENYVVLLLYFRTAQLLSNHGLCTPLVHTIASHRPPGYGCPPPTAPCTHTGTFPPLYPASVQTQPHPQLPALCCTALPLWAGTGSKSQRRKGEQRSESDSLDRLPFNPLWAACSQQATSWTAVLYFLNHCHS